MHVTSRETLDGLKAEWDDLLQRSSANTVFSTWEWQSVWFKSFGEGLEPHLLATRDDSRLVGISPLVMRDGVLSFAGGLDVSDYLDVIAEKGAEERVLSALLDYLGSISWNRLEMHFLRPTSPTLALLPALAKKRGLVVTRQQDDVCPFIDLPGDWEAYLRSLSKKDRHELRRKLRRLDAEASARWISIPSEEISDVDLDAFVRLCRQSNQDKAFFMDGRMEEFFRSMVTELRSLGVVRLSFLELDDRRVSAVLCFDQREELWLYNSGYDPTYSSLSVGLLLKVRCVHDAIEGGKSRFDFLRGSERYKYDLGGTDVPVSGLHVFPR
ncbi:MAG: GNAT family N-acetyltransferase [Chloroflexi bacterium]|nr:GNAT family N-acetyltransferase [Chloroflexota bacterium]